VVTLTATSYGLGCRRNLVGDAGLSIRTRLGRRPAKKAIRRSGCKLGAVKHRRGKRGKVLKQSPQPGKLVAPQTKVNLIVGR
jgi:hypothetical protein